MIDEFDDDFSNKIAPQNRAMTFSCFKSVLFFPLSSDLYLLERYLLSV